MNLTHRTADRARGVAAIEFALVLPVLVVLMALPLYLGWYQYHVVTAHIAAQNAARYLSKIPQSEIINPFRAPAVVAVAQQIADETLDELKPGYFPPSITILCSGSMCAGNTRPRMVSVNIQMTIDDLFFPSITQIRAPISVTAQVPYLGR